MRLPIAASLVLALSGTSARAADSTETALARCLDDPANASTAGQTECQSTALRAYDRRLNAAYAALLRTLPATAAQKLRASQRAWLAFRDAEQAMLSAAYATRQGTMYVPMQAAAGVSLTRDRVLQLEALRRVIEIDG